MGKNKVNVKINGIEYTLTGNEPEEYLFSIGNFVDKKIKEILRSNLNHSNTSATALAAILIADELFKLRREFETLKQVSVEPKIKLEELEREYEKLFEMYNSISDENNKLRQENQELLTTVEEFKSHYQEVSMTVDTYNEQLDALQRQIDDLTLQKQSLENEVNQKESDIEELKDKLLEGEIEIVRLKKELKEARDFNKKSFYNRG
ncbi:Cell division protein ZapA [Caloramator mitchellensis]|uniref:Cell division protein ZapA n=1 Tax=Caloramator mitchellensis TaxID=908809 RepID=A0A0R3JUW3_CALMK|nr:cell division protein ZapA [Caloramator mitchellensis]KRQ87347.1 Cell division protein ZapA [Caloramator mitchellensis]